MLFWRLYLSVEVTDEIHGIASVINIIQGKKPFTTSWDYHTGWCLLAPFYYVFIKMQHGSREGIVLFSRYLYMGCSLLMAIAISYVTYRKTKNELAFALLGIVSWVPFSIFQLNYNSLTVLLLLFAVFIGVNIRKEKNSYLWGIAGGLFGLACISYPTMVAITFIVVIIIFIMNRKEKNKYIFLSGLVIVGTVFIFWLLKDNSVTDIKNGIIGMLSSPHEQGKNGVDSTFFITTFRNPIINYIISPSYIWLFLVAEFIIYILNRTYAKKRLTDVSIVVFICYMFYNGYCFRTKTDMGSFSFSFFIATVLWLLFDENVKLKNYLMYILLEIVIAITYAFTSDNRNVLLGFLICNIITALFGILGIIEWFENASVGCRISNIYLYSIICFILCILVFSAPGILYAYSYVYGDERIEDLQERVPSGIFKGLYTTKEELNYVVDLERFVKDNIDDDKSICVVTREPMIYVMSDSYIFSPQTWDPQFLYRGNVSAAPLMDYFRCMGDKFPDMIIATNSAPTDFFVNNDYEIKLLMEKQYLLQKVENVDGLKIGIWIKKE